LDASMVILLGRERGSPSIWRCPICFSKVFSGTLRKKRSAIGTYPVGFSYVLSLCLSIAMCLQGLNGKLSFGDAVIARVFTSSRIRGPRQRGCGRPDVPKELKKEIQDVCTDLRTEIQGVRIDLRAEIQHVQSIALGSAYVTMRALSGKKDMMASWMQDIEKCVRSDGKDCASVKGIANAQNKK
jgi:hypothetical protein